MNDFTITDASRSSEEISNSPIGEDNIVVFYDVTALFANVPLNETINILVRKVFADDRFNQTYDLNLLKDQVTRLLKIATTNQLFQFNGQLYEQIEGVAMGSPLDPRMANVLLCHLEDELTCDGLMTTFYQRYLAYTLPPTQHRSFCRTFIYRSFSQFTGDIIHAGFCENELEAIDGFPISEDVYYAGKPIESAVLYFNNICKLQFSGLPAQSTIVFWTTRALVVSWLFYKTWW